MPEYNVTIENRVYKVELTKKEGEGLFEAKINDKPMELRLERSEAGTISPLTLRVADKEYQIELEKVERHIPFKLKVNNTLFQAQLRESTRRMITQEPIVHVLTKAERQPRSTATAGEGAVLAPMAGKIVSLGVKKGETVRAGDVVCILEAMKMENEITATKAGFVQEVNVSEGTPVNEGDILIVIK